MEQDHFAATVEAICAMDGRFAPDAYVFVRDALMFTTRQQRRKPAPGMRQGEAHVTGGQLLDGVRRYALEQFGPMVLTVFAHWRIERCEDFGTIVFNLIEANEFGKTETDTIADFQGGFDFEEAFVQPFRPVKAPVAAASAPAVRRARRGRSTAPKAG